MPPPLSAPMMLPALRAGDVAETEIGHRADDLGAEARRRHRGPLLQRISHELIRERVVDHAERAEVGVDLDGAFPARGLQALRLWER